VTFEGDYNARARVAQDGRNVVLVHQRDGQFQIAIHDLVTSRLQVLTNTRSGRESEYRTQWFHGIVRHQVR
jgi:Tol biopolymer transport system component